MWDRVPRPGIEPRLPALAARSLSHWTVREVPRTTFLAPCRSPRPSAGSSICMYLIEHNGMEGGEISQSRALTWKCYIRDTVRLPPGGAVVKNPPANAAAATAKSLQSCPTLCDPIDGSPPGCPVPGILQARTLEWAAISLSNAWKWKVKVKSLRSIRLLATPGTAAHQALPSMGFSRQEMLEWGAIANAGRYKRRGFDPWVRKIPWSRKWQPTLFLPQSWTQLSNGTRGCIWTGDKLGVQTEASTEMFLNVTLNTYDTLLSKNLKGFPSGVLSIPTNQGWAGTVPPPEMGTWRFPLPTRETKVDGKVWHPEILTARPTLSLGCSVL